MDIQTYWEYKNRCTQVPCNFHFHLYSITNILDLHLDNLSSLLQIDSIVYIPLIELAWVVSTNSHFQQIVLACFVKS